MVSHTVEIGSPALPRGFFLETSDSTGGGLFGCLGLVPAGLLTGPLATQAVAEGQARSLAGRSDLAFTALGVLARKPGAAGGCGALSTVSRVLAAPDTVEAWATEEGPAVATHVAALLHDLSAPRAPFAGLDLSTGPGLVMGIVNVTPDSFSDGGDHFDPAVAIAAGQAMLEAGAAILDIGGESTRPGARPVSPAEEIARIEPVVRTLAERGAVISIDTRHAAVMDAALAAGARIINDVTALEGDPESLSVAVRRQAPVILMHMQGEPQTMQSDPVYGHAPLEVFGYLAQRLAVCRRAGVPLDRICVDPGIGFGKTVSHNLQLLHTGTMLHGLGCGVLMGASRKRFIGSLSGADQAKARMPGSLMVAADAAARGMQILRVHDVPETVQALTIARAIRDGG